MQFVKPSTPTKEETKGDSVQGPLVPQDVFVAAEPIGPLEEPIYPSRVADGRAWLTTVGVKLTISPQGTVTDVEPSLLAVTIPGPFLAEFRTAVEKAVRTWRFNPAEVRHVRPEQRGQGVIFWVVTSSERVGTTVDVAFTFSGTGEMRLNPAR